MFDNKYGKLRAPKGYRFHTNTKSTLNDYLKKWYPDDDPEDYISMDDAYDIYGNKISGIAVFKKI